MVLSKMLSKHACLEATPPTCCHIWGRGERQGRAGEMDCFAAVAGAAAAALLLLLGDGERLYCLCLGSKAISIS